MKQPALDMRSYSIAESCGTNLHPRLAPRRLTVARDRIDQLYNFRSNELLVDEPEWVKV